MIPDNHIAVPIMTIVEGNATWRAGHSTIRLDGSDAGHASGTAGQPAGETARRDPVAARLFCLVSAERAAVLLPALREHFAVEPLVAVLIERRTPRGAPRLFDPAARRQRRAPIAERDPVRALPPELHDEAGHLRLVQPLEPVRRTHEDSDTAEVIDNSLRFDAEAVSELWWRVFERVLMRLRLRLGHLPADPATEILGRILDELPGYDPEWESLPAWLDAVVDRYAETRLSARAAGQASSGIFASRAARVVAPARDLGALRGRPGPLACR